MTDEELIGEVWAVIRHNDSHSRRIAAKAAVDVITPEIERRLLERFRQWAKIREFNMGERINAFAKENGIDSDNTRG